MEVFIFFYLLGVDFEVLFVKKRVGFWIKCYYNIKGICFGRFFWSLVFFLVVK